MSWVTDLLIDRRDAILTRWLDTAAAQPFHYGRRDSAVADDIPRLLDALVALLQREEPSNAPPVLEPDAPFDDVAVTAAAQAHARTRAEQGLKAAEVVVEFRLLRREVRRALHDSVPDGTPDGLALSYELLVIDALDGAIAVGLETFSQRLEAVREDFLATTVHEVRHPLTVIHGTAQLAARALARPQPDLERVAAALTTIRIGADRLAELLNALVDSSRAALESLDLQPAPVDLVALARDAVARLSPQIAGRVRLSTARADAFIEGDPARLRQVLINLLSNAAKYAPPATPIDVTLDGDASEVHLSVRDEGIGIASDELPLLFQRYGRTPTAVDQGIEGLGLGLYICRAIVERHGGRIWAESPGHGQGTTMRVTLPRHVPPEPVEN